MNQQILPAFLSVVDDPSTQTIAGIDLNGYYTYDDEGVRARPVTVVEKGVLRNFLPIMVYRVYVDGRPDEFVRGVDLIGTPLTSFS